MDGIESAMQRKTKCRRVKYKMIMGQMWFNHNTHCKQPAAYATSN
jgi:hypothetical protein